jgi:hypothetical protein
MDARGVDGFEAVHDRAALDGDTATVGFDLIIGGDAPDGHVEIDRHLVLRAPGAADVQVAPVEGGGDGGAVDVDGVPRRAVVDVVVQPAGRGLVADPARDAEGEVEGVPDERRVDGQCDGSRPRGSRWPA